MGEASRCWKRKNKRENWRPFSDGPPPRESCWREQGVRDVNTQQIKEVKYMYLIDAIALL